MLSQCREQGKALLRAGQYRQAFDVYCNALLNSMRGAPDEVIEAIVWNNISTCAAKLGIDRGEFEAACSACLKDPQFAQGPPGRMSLLRSLQGYSHAMVASRRPGLIIRTDDTAQGHGHGFQSDLRERLLGLQPCVWQYEQSHVPRFRIGGEINHPLQLIDSTDLALALHSEVLPNCIYRLFKAEVENLRALFEHCQMRSEHLETELNDCRSTRDRLLAENDNSARELKDCGSQRDALVAETTCLKASLEASQRHCAVATESKSDLGAKLKECCSQRDALAAENTHMKDRLQASERQCAVTLESKRELECKLKACCSQRDSLIVETKCMKEMLEASQWQHKDIVETNRGLTAQLNLMQLEMNLLQSQQGLLVAEKEAQAHDLKIRCAQMDSLSAENEILKAQLETALRDAACASASLASLDRHAKQLDAGLTDRLREAELWRWRIGKTFLNDPTIYPAVGNMLQRSLQPRQSGCNVMQHVEVEQVSRIVNASLWDQYIARAKAMSAQHGQQPIDFQPLLPPVRSCIKDALPWVRLNHGLGEVLLFHATRPDTANFIMQQGFEVQGAGSGSVYEEVINFGSEAHGLAQDTESDAPMRRRCILICRVLLGHTQYKTGPCQREKRPPDREACDPPQGIYDSFVVNHTCNGGPPDQDRREFAVFNADQAYPELAIWFNA